MSRVLIRPNNPTRVEWTEHPNTELDRPRWTGFTSLPYAPNVGRILFYASPITSSTFFSTSIFAYQAATNSFVRKGGNDHAVNTCGTSAASDVQPWPFDRHPEHMAYDTTRNRLAIYSGVCQGNNNDDLWYYDPQANTMAEVDISASVPTVGNSGALAYSSAYDVFVLLGPNGSSLPETWIFAPVDEGESLSSQQLQSGVSVPNRWTKMALTAEQHPTQAYFRWAMLHCHQPSGLVYAFLFDQGDSTPSTMEVWTYNISTQGPWINRNASNAPSEGASTSPEQLIIALTSGPWSGKFLYHQTAHNGTGGVSKDYLYDPVANGFSLLTTAGGGPDKISQVAWDTAEQCIVAHEYGERLWQARVN